MDAVGPLTVVMEIEYDVMDEAGARALAELHAGWIFSHPEVVAVSADLKRPRLPITEQYLSDDQMTVDEAERG